MLPGWREPAFGGIGQYRRIQQGHCPPWTRARVYLHWRLGMRKEEKVNPARLPTSGGWSRENHTQHKAAGQNRTQRIGLWFHVLCHRERGNEKLQSPAHGDTTHKGTFYPRHLAGGINFVRGLTVARHRSRCALVALKLDPAEPHVCLNL